MTEHPGPIDLIKVEVNLLRLPLFALSTKGLRTLDGIECRGTHQRNEQRYEYLFRATRNVSSMYPGPLSRAAHQAFLSIATTIGFPIENPIRWDWRDLCRRIGISAGGQQVKNLKAAIDATLKISIDSEHALYSKNRDELIHSVDHRLHLYERVTYVDNRGNNKSDNENGVWLSDWYLQNLNNFYTAPLDYELWRWLDRQSTIASRLYEFFLLSFHCGTPLLRINYATLTQLLPVTQFKKLSRAKQQLAPAISILKESKVLAQVDWTDSRKRELQLHFYPGNCLTSVPTTSMASANVMTPTNEQGVTVTELRDVKPPEWIIVCDFYRLWAKKDNHTPSAKELVQAGDYVTQFGASKAKGIIPHVVKLMQHKWPDAKSFGAIAKYIDDAAKQFDTEKQCQTNRRQQDERVKREREAEKVRLQEQTAFRKRWQPVWDMLPQREQEKILNEVFVSSPFLRNLGKDSSFVRELCLRKVQERSAAS